jgi:pyruvate kinase
LTTDESVARTLALSWGVHAVFVGPAQSFREMIATVEHRVVCEGFAESGAKLVFLAGFPVGSTVNTLRITGIE